MSNEENTMKKKRKRKKLRKNIKHSLQTHWSRGRATLSANNFSNNSLTEMQKCLVLYGCVCICVRFSFIAFFVVSFYFYFFGSLNWIGFVWMPECNRLLRCHNGGGGGGGSAGNCNGQRSVYWNENDSNTLVLNRQGNQPAEQKY